MNHATMPAKHDPYATVQTPPRALASAQLPTTVQRARPSRSASYVAATSEEDEYEPMPGVPDYVNGFLKQIKRFRTARDTPRWDETATMAYWRAIRSMTEAQVTECLFLLLEREEFRPSPKKVKAVASEVLGLGNRLPDPNMQGTQTNAYKPLPIPTRKAIAGRTSIDARAAARASLSHLPGWGLGRAVTSPKTVLDARPSDPNHVEKVKRQLAEMRRECEAQGTL